MKERQLNNTAKEVLRLGVAATIAVMAIGAPPGEPKPPSSAPPGWAKKPGGVSPNGIAPGGGCVDGGKAITGV